MKSQKTTNYKSLEEIASQISTNKNIQDYFKRGWGQAFDFAWKNGMNDEESNRFAFDFLITEGRFEETLKELIK